MVHKTETPPSSIKDRIVDPETIAVVGDGVVVVGQKSSKSTTETARPDLDL